MKKYFIIIILIILNILVYMDKTILSSSSKINLDLKEEEIALSIISLDNSKSILINKKDLFVLEYIDSLNLEKVINLYGVNILRNLIQNNNDLINIKSYNKQTLNNKIMIDNITFEVNDNIKIINYKNYNFCIYKSGTNKNLSICNFIYFLDMDNINFSDEVLAVFFDKNIKENKIEKYYDKWVDSYILNDKTFYTLKFLNNDYEVIEDKINIQK